MSDVQRTSPGLSVEKSEQELSDLANELQQVQDQLVQAHEREQRALADYQNLIRRTDGERLKLIKLASRGLVADLLQPLEHLSLAADHLQDAGLSMAIKQLWQQLDEHGLKEIKVMGKEFDVNTMEAVESDGVGKKKAEKVVKIVRRGYTLNGEVLQHAKVVLG